MSVLRTNNIDICNEFCLIGRNMKGACSTVEQPECPVDRATSNEAFCRVEKVAGSNSLISEFLSVAGLTTTLRMATTSTVTGTQRATTQQRSSLRTWKTMMNWTER